MCKFTFVGWGHGVGKFTFVGWGAWGGKVYVCRVRGGGGGGVKIRE